MRACVVPALTPGRRALAGCVAPLVVLALLAFAPSGRAGAPASRGTPPAAVAPGLLAAPDIALAAVPAAPAVSAATARPRQEATGGTQAYVVDLASGARSFLLHLPSGRTPGDPRPLVLALPGPHLGGRSVETDSGLNAVSDTTGALVAYVDGDHGSWNAGRCCGYAAEHGTDDITALHQLVDAIATLAPVDRRRVVVAGFSNGGMLAYRFACEHPREVAGVVVVSAALVTPDCTPSAPVSVVVAHGLLDRTVPAAGQRASNLLHTSTAPLPASLAPFSRLDGCRSTRTLQDGRWSVELRRRCRQGSSITVFRDARGRHRWPATVPGGHSFSAAAYGLLAGRRALADFGQG